MPKLDFSTLNFVAIAQEGVGEGVISLTFTRVRKRGVLMRGSFLLDVMVAGGKIKRSIIGGMAWREGWWGVKKRVKYW